MADSQQNLIPVEIPDAPFPAPPPLWKHFTTNNLDTLTEKESQIDFDLSTLPYPLTILKPPPPPESAYTVFNTTYTNPPEPTLPLPTELLFNPTDLTRSGSSSSGRPHVRMLLLLLKSLNLNFLEFMTIMADDPAAWEGKMRDIGMILENIMAVINLLRPHQAKESVKAMLERRLTDGREELERCDEVRGRIEEFLRGLEEEGRREKEELERKGMTTNGVQTARERKRVEEVEKARQMWAMLEDLDTD